MTLDEVVAANVRRLREQRGMSIGTLARKLGVARHVAYDYEGRRSDRPQRPFRWTELVSLCGALQCSLYQLVLPSLDCDISEVDDAPVWLWGVADRDYRITEDRVSMWRTPPGRAELGLVLFGVPGDVLLGGESPLGDYIAARNVELQRRAARDRAIREQVEKFMEKLTAEALARLEQIELEHTAGDDAKEAGHGTHS